MNLDDLAQSDICKGTTYWGHAESVAMFNLRNTEYNKAELGAEFVGVLQELEGFLDMVVDKLADSE